MKRIGVLVAVLLALATVGSAQAATVAVTVTHESGYKGNDDSYSTVAFTAAPGEANRVELGGDAKSVIVRDNGAPLDAGKDCVAIDVHAARCAASGPAIFDVKLLLGDGADELTAPRPDTPYVHVDARGAGGNDRLVGGGHLDGGEGADQLTGADAVPGVGFSGEETLIGGGGKDVLRGLSGKDRLDGDGDAAPSDDILDGGADTDKITYRLRPTPVRIDLATGRGGSEGERDTYTGIEDAVGGLGSDVIAGDGAPNWLDGFDGPNAKKRGGDDKLYGRGGNDELDGWAGDDLLDGGDGNDLLIGYGGSDHYLGGGGEDRIDIGLASIAGDKVQHAGCGSGRADVVYGPTPETIVARDCERVSTQWYDVMIAPLVRSRPAFTAVVPQFSNAEPKCAAAEIVAGKGRRFRSPRLLVPVNQIASVSFSSRARSAAGRSIRLYVGDDCAAGQSLRRIDGFKIAAR